MSDTPVRNLAEHMNNAATLWTATVCHNGTDAFLNAHEDYLSVLGRTAADWLERRQEAGTDARQFVERLRNCKDFAEIMRVQRDWYTAAWRRMAADYSTMATMTMAIMEPFARPDRETEPASETSSETATATSRRPLGQAAAALREASTSHLLASRANRAASQQPSSETGAH